MLACFKDKIDGLAKEIENEKKARTEIERRLIEVQIEIGRLNAYREADAALITAKLAQFETEVERLAIFLHCQNHKENILEKIKLPSNK